MPDATPRTFPSDMLLELVVAFHEQATAAHANTHTQLTRGMLYARASMTAWWLGLQVVEELLAVALAKRCSAVPRVADTTPVYGTGGDQPPTRGRLPDGEIFCCGCRGAGVIEGHVCRGCKGAGKLQVPQRSEARL